MGVMPDWMQCIQSVKIYVTGTLEEKMSNLKINKKNTVDLTIQKEIDTMARFPAAKEILQKYPVEHKVFLITVIFLSLFQIDFFKLLIMK